MNELQALEASLKAAVAYIADMKKQLADAQSQLQGQASKVIELDQLVKTILPDHLLQPATPSS